MPPDEARAALIVATNEYRDVGLRELRAPAHDAQELARVLGDESIGNFDVKTLINQPQYLVMEELEAFFSDRRRDDLLILYFSCHGVKDDDGRLHFAATNTRRNRLASTAVPADWVTQQMDRSRSNRVVLMLDCCYSGAFGRGVKGDGAVGVKERFDGRGRVILTASNAIEYSFEGDEVSGTGEPSVFTGALVHGLETGEADRGGDGLIDVDELYDYVYGKVRESTPNQTPGKWALGVEGELYVARSRAQLKPRPLPPELSQAVASPFSSVREGAVKTLSQLLSGGHGGLSLSAREVLQSMADEDDSRVVSRAAVVALAQHPEETPVGGQLGAARIAPEAETPTGGRAASEVVAGGPDSPEGPSGSLAAQNVPPAGGPSDLSESGSLVRGGEVDGDSRPVSLPDRVLMPGADPEEILVATVETAAQSEPASTVEAAQEVLEPDSPPQPTVEPAFPRPTRAPLRYQFIRERQPPVAVQPLEGAPAEPPAGQSSTQGDHGLWFALDAYDVAVEPGGEVTLSAQVLNKGTVVDRADIGVFGVPSEWVSIVPPRVNLDVGGEAVVAIRLVPPRAPTTVSGPIDVEVVLWSASNPQVRCAQRVRVAVGAFYDLKASASPRVLTTRRKGEFTILLHNNGNQTENASIEPRTEPGVVTKVVLQIEPRRVAIPPGEAASVKVRARTVKVLVGGIPITHSVQLSVLSGGRAEPVDLSLVQQPLLSPRPTKGLPIVVMVLALTAGTALCSSWAGRAHAVPNLGDGVPVATARQR